MEPELRYLPFLIYKTVWFRGKDSSCVPRSAFWIDYVRKDRRWWKNSIILQQHKRMFWARNKFFVEDHARVFVWKLKMMELLNVRQLFEVLPEKCTPVVHRNNHSPVVRANKLCFVKSSSAGGLYQSRKFIERWNVRDFEGFLYQSERTVQNKLGVTSNKERVCDGMMQFY